MPNIFSNASSEVGLGDSGWRPAKAGAAGMIARHVHISPTDCQTELGCTGVQRCQWLLLAIVAVLHALLGNKGGPACWQPAVQAV